MVQDIEYFGTKLKVKGLVNWKGSMQSEIPLSRAKTSQCISTKDLPAGRDSHLNQWVGNKRGQHFAKLQGNRPLPLPEYC